MTDEGPATPRSRVLAGPVFAALGVAIGISVLTSLPVGSLSAPGPGLWPAVISAVLVLSGCGRFVSDLRTIPPADRRLYLTWPTVGTWRVLAAVASLFVFAYVFAIYGASVSVFALVLGWQVGLFGRPWIKALVSATVTTVLVIALFELMLRLQLPKDIVLTWIGWYA